MMAEMAAITIKQLLTLAFYPGYMLISRKTDLLSTSLWPPTVDALPFSQGIDTEW